MNGKQLPLHARREDGRTEFKLSKDFCRGCAYKDRCRGFGKKYISIMNEEDRLVINRLLRRSRTAEFKEKYKRRKAIVEPVFGNIKNKGMKILVVGEKKVSTWWKIACTMHNIEKIINNKAKRRA